MMWSSRSRSERGAILIHVAVGSIVLIAFTMFVVDYGILWLSRTQAQTSADAGALAGAVALALDDPSDRSDTGPTKVAAHNFALNNDVFGEDPNVDITTDIRFYPDDPAAFPNECVDDTCVRVDVFRNQTRGNPLPMWFGQLVGLNAQGVRAMAIARAGYANASDCLRPWAVADRWFDWSPPLSDGHPATQDDTFDPEGTQPIADDYVPPTDGNAGSGYHPIDDLGASITLKVGNPAQAVNPGWFLAVDLSGDPLGGPGNNGGACYRDNIPACSDECNGTWGIGDYVPIENGNMVGPTNQGTTDLINLDPDAEYNDACKCVESPLIPSVYDISPRIIPVPMFDVEQYFAEGGGPGSGSVQIVKIFSMFVESVSAGEVQGIFMGTTGLDSSSHTEGNENNSFLRVIQLIR